MKLSGLRGRIETNHLKMVPELLLLILLRVGGGRDDNGQQAQGPSKKAMWQ